MQEKEIWKNIKYFKGYQVSNFGNVKNLNFHRSGKEGLLSKGKDRCGYLCVDMYRNGKKKRKMIHRLVAEAFIPNERKGIAKEVNHKDENKKNNHYSNLEWVTGSENINYGTRNQRAAFANFNGKCSKPVMQYDLEGHFIREWPSLSQIKRETGCIGAGNCCRGTAKTAYGFIWKFKEEVI